MKKLITLTFVVTTLLSFGQKEDFKLDNALVVAMLDKQDERFSLEVALTEFFNDLGVKAVPSINILKQGEELESLASDSIRQVIESKGIDTYMLVNVRGYDKRFKPATRKDDLKTALGLGSLFALYRPEVVNVSLEFYFYRNDELIRTELIRCGNVSSKESVLKRLRKKLRRKSKKWLS